MITLQSFNKLNEDIKEIINAMLDEIKNDSLSDYILFIADADHMPNIGEKFLPYVVDYRRDTYGDETRREFLNTVLNNFYSFNKSNVKPPYKECIVEDNEIQISIELMVYSHIWESEYYLKKCSRLALLKMGKSYKWKVEIPPTQKSIFIKNDIINNLKKENNSLVNYFSESYDNKLRNSFAHCSYSLDSDKKVIVVKYLKKGKISYTNISYDEWSLIFCKSFLLNYHLINILDYRRKNIIKELGKDTFSISLPQKRILSIKYDEKRDSFHFIR